MKQPRPRWAEPRNRLPEQGFWALCRELAALEKRAGSHDRGRVIRDLAVVLAGGGDSLTDLGAVRDQSVLCHANVGLRRFGGQSAAANVDTLRHMARAASSGSRLTVKGRATRARIIDAAAQLMYEKGAANTTFEDVRKAAKASGSQMSHYFADKRSLIRAVIAHQADAVMADHHDRAMGNLDSIAALRAWAERIVEQQRAQNFEGGCRLGSLAAELVESDAELQADFAAGFERWEALLRRGLLTMQQRGDLRPDADPDALAYSLLAAAQGGYLLTQAHRDARALQAALGAAIDHIESLAVEASKRSTE